MAARAAAGVGPVRTGSGESMKTRLGVAVAALMLGAQLGSPAAAQEPSLEQLALISQYIEANDLESLISFIAANPELLEGETALAVRLREFMIAAGDLSRFLAFDPRARDAITRALTDGAEADLFDRADDFADTGNGAPPAAPPALADSDDGTDDAAATDPGAGPSPDPGADDVADAGGTDPAGLEGGGTSLY
jgi:hypothetical protein